MSRSVGAHRGRGGRREEVVVTTPSLSALDARLARPPAPATFSEDELEGVPPAARRHLTFAIAPGAPLATAARLTMRGRIKVGRWLPFRARQVLAPHDGFVWAARVAGLIRGSDHYVDGAGLLDWKLAGLVTVAHAEGPDVARSAAGRGGAEGMWVPTALLPRFGVRWSDDGDGLATAHYAVGTTPLAVRYRLGPDGRARTVVFDRWGDPDGHGAWGWHAFGGEITAWRTFGGVTVGSAGRFGWFFGTARWPEGEFFRFELTDLRPVAGPVG